MALLGAWVAGSLAISWRLTRRWREPFAEPLPREFAGRARELRLATSDGEELGAWYLPPTRASAPSVALFHGLKMSRTQRIAQARVFEGFGAAVLLVTHRAHGDSSGDREDYGWSAQHDVIAAVQWLEREREGSAITVCGASLGAAAATYAARELGSRVAGYILECPYATAKRAAWRRANAHLPPVIDFAAYAGVQLGAAVFAPHWSECAPIEAVRVIPTETPVLLFAAERDTRAPPDDVASIATNVRGPCDFAVVPDAQHDRLMLAGDFYAEALTAWLTRNFGAH